MRLLAALLALASLVACAVLPTPPRAAQRAWHLTPKGGSSVSWSVTFYNNDGTTRGTLGLDHPVESLPSIVVGPDGDCKEAIIRLVAADLPFALLPFGIAAIHVDGVPVFRGYVATLGKAFSRELSTVKLVGLKDRFYDVNAKRPFVGTDAGQPLENTVSVLVNDAISASGEFAGGLRGVTYDASLVPTSNLSVPRIIPGFATFGTILDELAAQALTGTTWGVGADGRFFFRVPAGTLEIDEALTGALVDWQDVAAEGTITGLTWVLDRPAYPLKLVSSSSAATTAMPTILAHQSLSADHAAFGPAFRTVGVPAALSPYSRASGGLSLSVAWGSGTPGAIINPANAFDADDTTFASVPLDATGFAFIIVRHADYGAWVGASVRVADAEARTLRVGIDQAEGQADFHYYETDTDTLPPAGPLVVLSSAELSALAAHRASTGADRAMLGLRVLGPANGTVKVFDLRPLAIDAVTLDKIARDYFVSPALAAASVTLPGIVGSRPNVALRRRDAALADLGLVTVPAEQYEYEISPSGFKVTRVRLGQRFDAETHARLGLSRWQNDETALRAITFTANGSR